jgi:hypothetical protein
LPQYDQPAPLQQQTPAGYPPAPPQPQWTPQAPPQHSPQTHKTGGGGAGKWIAIAVLVLGLAGGGGWYGWKIYHPAPHNDDNGGSGGKENTTDWILKGDEAQKAGDFHKALEYFKKDPSAAARIQSLQAAVEQKVGQDVDSLSDNGQFDKADAEVAEYQGDYPTSEKLQALKDKIGRRRKNQ